MKITYTNTSKVESVNLLKDLQSTHNEINKKRKHSLSYFNKENVGDVEHNICVFNNSVDYTAFGNNNTSKNAEYLSNSDESVSEMSIGEGFNKLSELYLLDEQLLTEAKDKRDSLTNTLKIGPTFSGTVFYGYDNKIFKTQHVNGIIEKNLLAYIDTALDFKDNFRARVNTYRIYSNGKLLYDSINDEEFSDYSIQYYKNGSYESDLDYKEDSKLKDLHKLKDIAKELLDRVNNSETNDAYKIFDSDEKLVFDTSDLKSSQIGKELLTSIGDKSNKQYTYKLVIWMSDDRKDPTKQKIAKVFDNVLGVSENSDNLIALKSLVKSNPKINSIVKSTTSSFICVEIYNNLNEIVAFLDELQIRHKNKSDYELKPNVPKFDFNTNKIKNATASNNADNTSSKNNKNTDNGKLNNNKTAKGSNTAPNTSTENDSSASQNKSSKLQLSSNNVNVSYRELKDELRKIKGLENASGNLLGKIIDTVRGK